MQSGSEQKGGCLRIFEATPLGEGWAQHIPGEAQAPSYPTRQQMTGQGGSEVTWEEHQESGTLYSNGSEQLFLLSDSRFLYL